MNHSFSSSQLTEPQLAALAKVACGAETGGGIVLLVGPPGVGKSLILQSLVGASLQPLHLGQLGPGSHRVKPTFRPRSWLMMPTSNKRPTWPIYSRSPA